MDRMKIKNIAIIPARGGSKRIPRKNIKDFLGQPIIVYSIDAALKSQLFDEVMVSTDDEEIAEISQKYGAQTPFFRSDKNADDFATTFDVIEEVLLEYQKLNRIFDNVCCIYPCAPFVSSSKLILAYQNLIQNNCDSVVPIVPFSFPIQRSFILDKGNLKYSFPEFKNSRSQDLVQHYHDAGQFYWSRISNMLKNRSLVFGNSGYVEFNEMEVQDIDNEVDWKMAEIKYKMDLNE